MVALLQFSTTKRERQESKAIVRKHMVGLTVQLSLTNVTSGFKDKTECITIYMTGSSFIHTETL